MIWYKIRYMRADGTIVARCGSDLLTLSAECDGTIIAMYSWTVELEWKVIYRVEETIKAA